MKDIRNYSNYREFLSSCFEEEKSNFAGSLSLATYANRLGLSDSLFRMNLAGQRNLTLANILKVAKALKLNFEQTELFEAMVCRDQSSLKNERAYYAKKLKSISQQIKLDSVRTSQEHLLHNPLVPSLLVYLMDRKQNLNELSSERIEIMARELRVTKLVLQEALDQISKSHILESSHGNTHLIFDKVMSSIGKLNYLKQVFVNIGQSIGKEVFFKSSLISVKTFSIEPNRVQEFGEEYKALVEKYMQSDTGKKIDPMLVQVSFCLSPVGMQTEKFSLK